MISSAVGQADEHRLAKDGVAAFVIVTPAKPVPEEVTAANWLATTLKQVTGADFAIKAEDATDLPKAVLLVGNTAEARKLGIDAGMLQSEEWRIKSVGESLILAGGRPRGTVYAVCEFLEEQCGVLRLDPFTEVIPSQPTLTIPAIDRSGRPAFPLRMLFTGFPYGHPAGGGPLIEQYQIANKNNINGRITSGDHARVIPTGVHTFGEFISSKEFAALHPEYFGMDSTGKRLTDDMGTPSAWTQLCVTNDHVRRITLERAKKFILDERAAAIKEGREPSRMLVLSQNDNTTNLCLCLNCKAIADREGSESGPQHEFVNHVARGLKDEFPDVLVQTEAYNFTLAAPKTIRPEANVVVRFCDNYGPAAQPMRALLERIEDRQVELSIRVVDVQRHVWDEQFCDAAFFADAFHWLDEAMLATAADLFMQTHIQRERIIIDSAFLWLEEHVRQSDPADAKSFPKRADLLSRFTEPIY